MTETSTDSRPLTDAQREAITTTDRNVVVIAGAGTGKTFVLVQRFIEQFAQHPDWPISAVVAITFTNRAAGEMRSRVRDELGKRLRAAVTPAERRRWSDLLSQIEAARITTIHGLCSEIARANAAAAGIDPGFDIIETAQAVLLREDAVTRALAELSSDACPLSPLARQNALDVAGRYGEEEIRTALKNSELLSASRGEALSREELYATWEADVARLLQLDMLPALTFTPPNNDDRLATVYREAIRLKIVLTSPLSSVGDRFEALTALAGLKAIHGQTGNWPDLEAGRGELKELIAAANDLVKRLDAPPDAQDDDAAALLAGWHALFERTRWHYDELKRQRAVLDYDDLEFYASEVLRHDDVRARYVGTEFRHVMVDEFQDTNARQWAIVRAVAPPENAGSLFIVGDPKQAIYTFRGADVTVFEKARQDIVAHGGAVVHLSRSFRTHGELVSTLNALFAEMLQRPDDAIERNAFVVFDEAQQLSAKRQTAPDAPFIGVYTLLRGDDGESALSREARTVAHRLREMVRRGERLVFDEGTYRPVRYGDIALLLRTFSTRVAHFERAFSEAGIPFVTFGGRGFYGQREVRDLISALRALYNPADNLALAAALHSPLFAVSDVDLLLLRQKKPMEGEDVRPYALLYDALMHEADERRGHDAYDPLVFSADVLAELRPFSGRAPVETLLSKLIHATGYMATLNGLPNGTQMRANVDKLMDNARSSGITALNLFVRHLNDMTDGVVREGGAALQSADAVRITTIHSSKGLEYPVVWLADAGSTRAGGHELVLNLVDHLGCKMPRPDQEESGKTVVHPYLYRRNRHRLKDWQDAERLRLFYVAATRAADALFISGTRNKNDIPGWLGAVAGHLSATSLNPPVKTPRAETPPPEAWDGDIAQDYPLARTLPAAPPPERLHLSASDITALGGKHRSPDASRRRKYEYHLRRRIFNEQQQPLPLLTYDSKMGRLSARVTGILTHDALRYGYDTLLESDPAQLNALLSAMAWEEGLTYQDDIDRVVDSTLGALNRYRRSELCRELDATRAVYRELPFVFQRDGHVIHGIIDLLYRDSQGRWTLIDFKTDNVPEAALRAHAQTYHLQMAVYAEAVAAQTGTSPRVQLVFLKYPDKPVTLDAQELADELAAVPLRSIVEAMAEPT